RRAARRARDDGRAVAAARHARGVPAAAAHQVGPARARVSPSDFSWEPVFLGAAAVAAAGYAWAARRDRPGRARIAAYAGGLLLIAASLDSPLENIAAHYLLLMHLLQNALIADVAPLLVMLGLTAGMREKLKRRGLGRIRSRWILPIWLAAWYLTHIAPFYDWALRT